MTDFGRIDLMLEHAELIRQRIDFPFDAVALITLALERYAERFISTAHGSGLPKPFSAPTVAQKQVAGAVEVSTQAAPKTERGTSRKVNPAPGDFITRPNRGSASGHRKEDRGHLPTTHRMLSESALLAGPRSATSGKTAAPEKDTQMVGWRPTQECLLPRS